jgi:hypothetical protein
MSPVKRFICHFLIVWLTLLSGGAHAHAAADAAHEVGHMAMQTSELQTGSAMAAPGQAGKIDKAHNHDHTESCALSHCGHGHTTGMLSSVPLRLSDAPADAPLPSAQAWASREQPNTIERPKWVHTTSLVVNL